MHSFLILVQVEGGLLTSRPVRSKSGEEPRLGGLQSRCRRFWQELPGFEPRTAKPIT